MLWAVTGFAVLFAATQWLELSPLVLAGLAFLVVSIFLHVAGNAIGTRLRQLGDHRDRELETISREPRRPQAEDFAPPTRLSLHQGLGWTIIVATVAGAILGGASGGVWTALTSRGPLNPLAIGIGIVAFGTLGGLAAFGASALVQVLAGAIWQALADASTKSEVRNSKRSGNAEPADSPGKFH